MVTDEVEVGVEAVEVVAGVEVLDPGNGAVEVEEEDGIDGVLVEDAARSADVSA